jgi:hypothetical protein
MSSRKMSCICYELYQKNENSTSFLLQQKEKWSMSVLFQNLESLEQLSRVLVGLTRKVLSSRKQQI